ncbi:MAG TPA: cyclase family protein [Pyrinomonadaceae bacterium]|jgi:arylformamidase|nr:cyclase family protein [Pyrinomonadaceae bacterium]
MWLAVYYYSPMPIYDLSVPLSSELPIYPGDPGIQISAWSSLDNGDAASVSAVSFGAHTGTHVDAPAHFLQGAKKVEALALEVLIGEAQVIQVPDDCLAVDEEFLAANCAPGTSRVLFKTRNSALWTNEFETNFTYLELSAAERLVSLGVKLVGIDYLSIEKFGSKDHEVHRALLASEVIILEGLNFNGVPAGKYELICLPLRLRSKLGDGAPARAVLRTID